MKQRHWLLAPLSLLLAAFLVACGGSDDGGSPGGESSSSGETPAASGGGSSSPTLTVAVATFGGEEFDPGRSATANHVGWMYERLIGVDPDGTLSGERGLAESWETSTDGMSLTVKLHPDIMWHDGEPFTADDVVLTFGERYQAPDAVCTFCSQYKRRIAEVVAVDDLTVEFRFTEKDITFFASLSSRDTPNSYVVPRHKFELAGDGTYSLIGDPVGTGPWKFVSTERGSSVTFERNEDYWQTENVPEWDELVVRLMPEIGSRFSALRAGEVDMTQITPSQIPQVEEAGFQIDGGEGFVTIVTMFLAAYDDRFLTNQLEFRKALNLAVDMEAVLGSLYPDGSGERAVTAFWNTPLALGYDESLTPYPYDPDEAMRLLEEMDYDGRPLKVWIAPGQSSPEAAELLELLAGYWEAVGIRTELTPVDNATLRGYWQEEQHSFDTSYAGHVGIDTPPTRPMGLQNIAVAWLSPAAGGIIKSYHDLEGIDALYLEALKANTLDELDGSLRAINRTTYEEYPMVPVILKNDLWALGPAIESWEPGAYGFGQHWETLKRAD